jgi:hypothetical protein
MIRITYRKDFTTEGKPGCGKCRNSRKLNSKCRGFTGECSL